MFKGILTLAGLAALAAAVVYNAADVKRYLKMRAM